MISFVGAGPGAPDLITLRGRDRLAAADVVVWASSLVPVAGPGRNWIALCQMLTKASCKTSSAACSRPNRRTATPNRCVCVRS